MNHSVSVRHLADRKRVCLRNRTVKDNLGSTRRPCQALAGLPVRHPFRRFAESTSNDLEI